MILPDKARWTSRLRRAATRPPVAIACGTLVIALAVLLLADGRGAAALGGGAPAGRTAASGEAAARPAAQPTAALAAPAAGGRSAEAVEEALYGNGSLRRSQPDGGFRLDAAGRLLPDIGVRRRFDQLLTTLGEASIDELGRLLRAQAARDLKPESVEQVMTLWQAYLQLQRHVYAQDADITDPTRWQPALDERIRVRRELLGPAWADAFYRDEELAVRAHIAARNDPQAQAQVGPDTAYASGALPDLARRPRPDEDAAALQQRRVAALGADAAERLAAEDALQAQWDQRLADARQRVSAWQQAPELSPAQRQEAINRFLDDQFDSSERLRVRALLKLNTD